MTMNENTTSVDIDRFALKNDSGIYVLNFGACNCSVLESLLSPNLPIIWIRHHTPNPTLAWWKSMVPLSTTNNEKQAMIRNLSFDIQMEYREFLSVLSEFVPLGIELYQSEKRIPDTLYLDNITEGKRIKVLLDNGIRSGFLLPHANEQAQFWTSKIELIKRMLNNPQIVQLLIARH